MAGSWTNDETKTLLSIWGDETVQRRLDSAHRNRDIYQAIARDMEEQGYERTWQQCRTKIKNLVQKYRKVSYHFECGLVYLATMFTDEGPQ